MVLLPMESFSSGPSSSGPQMGWLAIGWLVDLDVGMSSWKMLPELSRVQCSE